MVYNSNAASKLLEKALAGGKRGTAGLGYSEDKPNVSLIKTSCVKDSRKNHMILQKKSLILHFKKQATHLQLQI